MGIMLSIKITTQTQIISKIRHNMIVYSNKGINFTKEA